MGRLLGEVVLITGGASGIGRACAQRFKREGAGTIVIGDLRQVSAEDFESLRGDGTRVLGLTLDVSDSRSCNAAADDIVKRFGRIDVLVHAAGINYGAYAKQFGLTQDRSRWPHILDMDPQYWSRMLDVNLSGTMNINRAAAGWMVKAGKGAIVNVTSLDAMRAVAGNAPYCVSKAAAWMFTKCFALELSGKGVRVNAIAPGFIDTPMIAALHQAPALLGKALEEIPLGKLGSPDQIAAAAAYLASEDAAYVTGSVLAPDGGLGTAFR
jgi:NAD(P)-dependent dehydrogenase (short-subunit alcohol dehydrogenase family)